MLSSLIPLTLLFSIWMQTILAPFNLSYDTNFPCSNLPGIPTRPGNEKIEMIFHAAL